MKKIAGIVIFTTLYLFVYTLFIVFDFPIPLISAMFTLSPFLVIYMVYKVLHDGVESMHRFDEGVWYEDYEVEH